MAKSFAPRISKRDRNITNIKIKKNKKRDLYKILDDSPLLKGADLEVLLLNEIVVKDQVRTKFNDNSLKELSENIKVNEEPVPKEIYPEKINPEKINPEKISPEKISSGSVSKG